LWHGRRCAGWPAFHVTTTQDDRVTPFTVWTELWVTLEEALPVAVALPVADELCVTRPTDGEPVPSPRNANSASNMNISAM
jgi:hypothetical protein